MKKYLLALSMLAAAIVPASAEEFFSTAKPDKLFDIGVRVGINTSNRTISNSVFNVWNQNSWGLGFDAGAVADINIRDFISVQPGFFFESRSGEFAYQSNAYDNGLPFICTQTGKGRMYLFTIPVVGSVHFNITDDLRWNVDFGPYLQIKLKSTFDKKFDYPETTIAGTIQYHGGVKTAPCDVGLKIGTGLDLYKHYYIGVHYMGGMIKAWNPAKLGGHNKAWVFTIGYIL